MVFLKHYRWNFGDRSGCVNHTVVAPLERNDVPLDRTATQICLQDTANHIYTTPGIIILYHVYVK